MEQRLPTAMLSEQARLRSFENGGWPLYAKAAPRDLAKHGFYYTNESDRVRCAFCGLEIENWTREMGADVYLAHWQPAHNYCRFLKGENVGNLPIQDNDEAVNPGRPTAGELDELRRVLSATLPATSTGRVTENYQGAVATTENEVIIDTQALAALNSGRSVNAPHRRETREQAAEGTLPNKVWTDLVRTAQYPHMASLQARLATFSRWPLLRPSPRQLAKAGLFCAKSPQARGQAWSFETAVCADSVKCFWCGERLHKWRCTDDAVLEHARLSPRCRFARQLLGDALHHDIVNSPSEESSLLYLSCRFIASEQPTATTTATQTMEESGEDDVMNSPAVRAVLQMGFPEQLIRELLGHNSHLLDAETLCSLALQAAQEQTSSHTPGDDIVERRVPGLTSQGQVGVTTHEQEPMSERLTGSVQGLADQSQGLSHQRRTSSQGHGLVDQGQRQAVEELLQEMGRKYSVTSYLTPQLIPAAPLEQTVQAGGVQDRLKCKVCQNNEVRVTFRPCGHLACCSGCAQRLTICPICQRPFTEKIVTYLS
ncbi:hypothetical protein BaRGS_00009343 [Batillaria attramentaria]|uniref:RING-type domain-containing protein n=1 Tax=Batillaria attramentaria TaxID=370345 RepID=A0ABD0LJU0_9CAEN